jgi:hypothetical protein
MGPRGRLLKCATPARLGAGKTRRRSSVALSGLAGAPLQPIPQRPRQVLPRMLPGAERYGDIERLTL